MRTFIIAISSILLSCSGSASRSQLFEGDAVQPVTSDLDDVPTENPEDEAMDQHCLGSKCLYSFGEDPEAPSSWYMIQKQGEERYAFKVDCGTKAEVQNLLGMSKTPLSLDFASEAAFNEHYKVSENPVLSCAGAAQAPQRFYEQAFESGTSLYYYFQQTDGEYRAFVFDRGTCAKEIDQFSKISGTTIANVSSADDLITTPQTLRFDCQREAMIPDGSKSLLADEIIGWNAYEAKGKMGDKSVFFILLRYHWENGEIGNLVIGNLGKNGSNSLINSQTDLGPIEDYLRSAFPGIRIESAIGSGTIGGGSFSDVWDSFDLQPAFAFNTDTAKLEPIARPAVVLNKAKRLVFRSSKVGGLNNRLEEIQQTASTDPGFSLKKGLGRLMFGDGTAGFATLQTLEVPVADKMEKRPVLHLVERCENDSWLPYLDYFGLTGDLKEGEILWKEESYFDRSNYDRLEIFVGKILSKVSAYSVNRIPCMRPGKNICRLLIDSNAGFNSFLKGEAAALAACQDKDRVTDLEVTLKKPSGQVAQDFLVKGAFVIGHGDKPGPAAWLPALQKLVIKGGDVGQETAVKLDCDKDCYTNKALCPPTDTYNNSSISRYPLLAFENLAQVSLQNLNITPVKLALQAGDALSNRQAAVGFKAVNLAHLDRVKIAKGDQDLRFGAGLCSRQSNTFVQQSDIEGHAIGVIAQNKAQIFTHLKGGFATFAQKGIAPTSDATTLYKITASAYDNGRAFDLAQNAKLLLSRSQLEGVRGIFMNGVIPTATGDEGDGPVFAASNTNFVFPVAQKETIYRKAAVDILYVLKKPSYLIKSSVGAFGFLGASTTGVQALRGVSDPSLVNNINIETPGTLDTKATNSSPQNIINLCSKFDEVANKCLSPF